jgi:uncharacterized protein YbaR (Trm112 family)
VPLPGELVDILACPRSKQPLIYFPNGESGENEAEGFLLCPASALRYRIENGVAVMLVEEAQAVPAADVARLVARARALGLSVPEAAISQA